MIVNKNSPLQHNNFPKKIIMLQGRTDRGTTLLPLLRGLHFAITGDPADSTSRRFLSAALSVIAEIKRLYFYISTKKRDAKCRLFLLLENLTFYYFQELLEIFFCQLALHNKQRHHSVCRNHCKRVESSCQVKLRNGKQDKKMASNIHRVE